MLKLPNCRGESIHCNFSLLLCTVHNFIVIEFNRFYLVAEDEEEEGVHLVPGSADDAPRTTGQLQGSAGETTPVSSRPSGRVVGIIKRNWHS